MDPPMEDILWIIIRIGFWGPLYSNYKKAPPKTGLVIIEAPILPVPTRVLTIAVEAAILSGGQGSCKSGLRGYMGVSQN